MGKLFLRGKKWYITYVDPYGKQVRTSIGPYREAAEMALKKIEMDMIEGRYLDKKKSRVIKFEQFADEFVQNYVNLENRRPKAQMGRINIIKEHFKGKYLDEVDNRMVRTFLVAKREGSKPATINRYLSMLKCMFNRAIEWKLLEGENPTNGIKKLPEDNERFVSLTDGERALLLSHCHGATRSIVLTALQTGLRWNEIINLEWTPSENSSYVDFNSNVIVIHSAWAKSKKSRYIPMTYALQCELFDRKKTTQSKYVFASPLTGRPYNRIEKSFRTAVGKAKLDGLRFHDLRHVFASNLVRKGVDLYTVQKLLGHSTPKMTERYAHLMPDHLKTAINEVNLVGC